MIFDEFRPWIELTIVLWNCGLTAVVWLRKPGEDAARAVRELRGDVEDRLAGQETKIAEILTHMEHMPTSEEMAALEGTVRQINERTSGLADGMKTVRASLNRIEDYLLRARP